MAKLQIKLSNGKIKEFEIAKGYVLGKDLFCVFLNKKGQAVIATTPDMTDGDLRNLIDEIKIIRG